MVTVQGIPVSSEKVRVNGMVHEILAQGGDGAFRVETPAIAKSIGGKLVVHTGWGETEEEAVTDLVSHLVDAGFVVEVPCPMCDDLGQPLIGECTGCSGRGWVVPGAVEAIREAVDVITAGDDDE